MSMLRFDCRFRYPSEFRLDLAFDAERGVTALIGPSGSGKTTVLNLIAGLLTPSDGEIALGERVLFDSRTSTNLPPNRRQIGYVFQDYQLFPHLSVLRNLRYGERRNRDRSDLLEKVITILELSELLQRPPAALSGGEKQRVALGGALLCSPKLLLLDEPLNAVDVELRNSIASYLGQIINEFQVPSLLVSHDRDGTAALANEAIELKVIRDSSS